MKYKAVLYNVSAIIKERNKTGNNCTSFKKFKQLPSQDNKTRQLIINY